jgi:hypothetical protein
MIIKKEIRKKKSNFFSFTKFLYFYFSISLVIISIILTAFYQSHFFSKEKNKFLDYLSKAGRYEYLYLPQIAFKAIKSTFYTLEKVNLELPFAELVIIEKLRKDSISNGRLPPTDKMPKIKANVIFKEKKYGTDIRLKGDRKEHFIDKEKSSYKLELDKNQYIFGIKKFSLQKPRIRNYIHEWIFHELSGQQNIIKVKYDFIDLYINGEKKGLYVIEEGFGKELIERNKRRNGPIFSLNEDIYENHDNPVFEIYNKKFWQKPENNFIARISSQKLHNFFDNKSNASEVFDLEKWAAFFAVIDLTKTYHGAFLKSVRLYYNPINGLFEPIPFDGHRHLPNYHKFNSKYDDRILIDILQENLPSESGYQWIRNFFYQDGKLNKDFYDLYSYYLNKISSKKYIDNFLSKSLDKIEKINSHIYADYFWYDAIQGYGVGLYYFLISDFKYQATNIRNKLKSKNSIQLLKINKNEYLFKSFFKNYNQLTAKKLICTRGIYEVELNLNQDIKNFSNTSLYVKDINTDGIICKSLVFYDKFNKKNFLLNVDHLNSEYIYKNFKKKYSYKFRDFFIEKGNNLILKNDNVEINTNIYIPKGYNVIIYPGQKLLLTNGAFIISNSPWNIGGKNSSVVISGKEDDLGGGILISDTKETSKIENTEFSNLAGLNFDQNSEYIILGSINFHQTKVLIKDVVFKNIFSEDAINIFRSNFNIYNANYANISSDAIDIDFSNGAIIKAKFTNIENDAIDFSGSNVNVRSAYFDNVNDKIISAGENSKINIDEIKGINSYAGIVSKDGSEVFSKNIIFDGVKIPFAAYQKKNEYKYPLLVTTSYKLKNFLTKSIKDATANLISDDETLVMKSKKLISLVYEKDLSLIN